MSELANQLIGAQRTYYGKTKFYKIYSVDNEWFLQNIVQRKIMPKKAMNQLTPRTY